MINLDSIVEVECLGHRFRVVDPSQYPFGDYEFRDELDVKAETWLDIAPGEIVVDVGASWGGWTMLALAQGAHVVAVEPGRTAAAVLGRNVAENGWEQRCTFASQILGDGSALDGEYREAMRVYFDMPTEPHSSTLDELVERLGLLRLDRIKSDIEGAEVELLRGASRTLKRWRPLLVIEDHTNPKKPNVREDCMRIAREAGYRDVRPMQPEKGNPFLIVRTP